MKAKLIRDDQLHKHRGQVARLTEDGLALIPCALDIPADELISVTARQIRSVEEHTRIAIGAVLSGGAFLILLAAYLVLFAFKMMPVFSWWLVFVIGALGVYCLARTRMRYLAFRTQDTTYFWREHFFSPAGFAKHTPERVRTWSQEHKIPYSVGGLT